MKFSSSESARSSAHEEAEALNRALFELDQEESTGAALIVQRPLDEVRNAQSSQRTQARLAEHAASFIPRREELAAQLATALQADAAMQAEVARLDAFHREQARAYAPTIGATALHDIPMQPTEVNVFGQRFNVNRSNGRLSPQMPPEMQTPPNSETVAQVKVTAMPTESNGQASDGAPAAETSLPIQDGVYREG